MSSASRTTKETAVNVDLYLDGAEESRTATGIRMFDHLLAAWAFHSRIAVKIDARSFDGITHHLVEDVAIALGQALSQALGERRAIARYADATIAMDDALVRCVLDLAGRPHGRVDLGLRREAIEDLASDLIPHFFTSLASNARITLHLDRLAGTDDHHVAEAAFKAFARAFRTACAPDLSFSMPSTKGSMT